MKRQLGVVSRSLIDRRPAEADAITSACCFYLAANDHADAQARYRGTRLTDSATNSNCVSKYATPLPTRMPEQ
jgi:hypothetical protein